MNVAKEIIDEITTENKYESEVTWIQITADLAGDDLIRCIVENTDGVLIAYMVNQSIYIKNNSDDTTNKNVNIIIIL